MRFCGSHQYDRPIVTGFRFTMSAGAILPKIGPKCVFWYRGYPSSATDVKDL
jgi:hypothetical protein